LTKLLAACPTDSAAITRTVDELDEGVMLAVNTLENVVPVTLAVSVLVA
jgi:hypothetical protein